MRIALLCAALLAPLDCGAESSVTVLAPHHDDPRIALVREAIDYWNGIFAEIGSAFRLGTPQVLVRQLPVQELRDLSDAARSLITPSMPQSILRLPGDLIVALSDADFISFATRWPDAGKALAAVKSHERWPLTLSNVARNVVAHEIGHAIGLPHNDDPAMLMCGRPAPCRPDAFQSDAPRIFALSEDEKERLRRLYPGPQ